MTQEIISLLQAYGFTNMGPQKNSYMFSFHHDEKKARINIYYTTMTVTLQQNDAQQHYKGIDLNRLEDILSNV